MWNAIFRAATNKQRDNLLLNCLLFSLRALDLLRISQFVFGQVISAGNNELPLLAAVAVGRDDDLDYFERGAQGLLRVG